MHESLYEVAWTPVAHFFSFLSFGPTMQHVGILFAHQGLKPAPPVVEAQSLHHWTRREVPVVCSLEALCLYGSQKIHLYVRKIIFWNRCTS